MIFIGNGLFIEGAPPGPVESGGEHKSWISFPDRCIGAGLITDKHDIIGRDLEDELLRIAQGFLPPDTRGGGRCINRAREALKLLAQLDDFV